VAPPVWAVGQVLTASDVNTWLVPGAVVKPADTQRSATTTMTADPDLVIAVTANATYYISGVIFYGGVNGTPGTDGLKCTFAVPASTTGQLFNNHMNLSQTFTQPLATNWTDTTTAGTTGVANIFCLGISGSLLTAGTAGNLTFQWAQAASNGTNLTIKANSFIVAQRIG